MQNRYWQNWDHGDTAAEIDRYWLRSDLEGDSRRMLGEDVKRVLGGRTIYEVGCGTGLMATEFFAQGWTPETYSGGDVSEKMLRIARERHPAVAFERADILDLRGQRENVVCIHVLQHLPHYRDALAQIVRFTTRRLYVVTWLTADAEDLLSYSPAGLNPGDQSFHDNRYALEPFLGLLRSLTNREPEVHRMSDLTCSVAVDLD